MAMIVGGGGDDSMTMMMTIDLLYTVTAGTRVLLYFNLSSHSPISFLHDDPVVRKRGNIYPLLELERLGGGYLYFCIIAVAFAGVFCYLLLSSLFSSLLSFGGVASTVGSHLSSKVI